MNLLGADSGLKGQYIVLRVNSIDAEKFKAAVGSGAGGLIMSITDVTPKAVLDVAGPVGAKYLRNKYGIDTTVSFSDAPPSQGPRQKSEFFAGALVTAGTIGGIYGLVKLAGFLIGKARGR